MLLNKSLKTVYSFDSVILLLGNYSKKIIRGVHGDMHFKIILNVITD